MKSLTVIVFAILSFCAESSEVITCGDVLGLKDGEAKQLLHQAAQQRAQREAENFTEKKIIKPYFTAGSGPGSPESMAALVEIYWCESSSTPLHSAYYRLYTTSKSFYQ